MLEKLQEELGHHIFSFLVSSRPYQKYEIRSRLVILTNFVLKKWLASRRLRETRKTKLGSTISKSNCEMTSGTLQRLYHGFHNIWCCCIQLCNYMKIATFI